MNLLHYIQGRRKGIDAHRIEREAMQDDFLSEALEGFESVAGDHAAVIQQMERQIARSPQPKGRSIMFWLSAAAGIALIIGFGWYFLLFESPTTPVLSEALSSIEDHEWEVLDQLKDKAMAAPKIEEDVMYFNEDLSER